MEILAIPFNTPKSNNDSSRRASRIEGVIYVEIFKNNNEIVFGEVMLRLKEGTEFNTHSQKKISKKILNSRKDFSEIVGCVYNTTKELHLIARHKLKVLNSIINKRDLTLLDAECVLRGNWANGSEAVKNKADLRVSLGIFEGLPFVNLISSLKFQNKKIKLREIDLMNKSIVSFDEMYNHLKNSNSIITKGAIDRFMDQKIRSYYISENRAMIFGAMPTENQENTKKLRAQFIANMKAQYEMRDWVYNTLQNTSIIELAHIKPVSHIIELHKQKNADLSEITDTKNGLILPITIHKLFDRGLITFEENGRIKCKTWKREGDFGLKSIEIEMLKINNFRLSKEIMSDRQEYLRYHREFIFEHGVTRSLFKIRFPRHD